MMRPIRRSFDPEPKAIMKRVVSDNAIFPVGSAQYNQASKKWSTVSAPLVIVDLDTIPYFDYEIKRAFEEIQLIHPKAADRLFVMTVKTTKTLDSTVVRIGTPYSISVNTASNNTVAGMIHQELLKYNIESSIIVCSASTLALSLKIIDLSSYKNIISCVSTAHLVRTCFEINYPDYMHVPDETIGKLHAVVSQYMAEPHFYPVKAYIENRIDGYHAMRDPRLELISGFRFNPWLLSFENIKHNGCCSQLIQGRQCSNKRYAGLNYCAEHKCDICNQVCYHSRVVARPLIPFPKVDDSVNTSIAHSATINARTVNAGVGIKRIARKKSPAKK